MGIRTKACPLDLGEGPSLVTDRAVGTLFIALQPPRSNTRDTIHQNSTTTPLLPPSHCHHHRSQSSIFFFMTRGTIFSSPLLGGDETRPCYHPSERGRSVRRPQRPWPVWRGDDAECRGILRAIASWQIVGRNLAPCSSARLLFDWV